jgi:SAM-dependent methyltransferase
MKYPVLTVATLIGGLLFAAPAWTQDQQATKPPEARYANDKLMDAYCEIDKALDLVGLRPGMTVGQIGTENGYLVLKLADRVRPSGRVLASGTNEGMLKAVSASAAAAKLAPIDPVVEREPGDPSFAPGGLDLVFLFDSWKFSVERLRNAAAALKPDGRAVLIVLEQGSRAVDASGSPVTEAIPNRSEVLRILGLVPLSVDRIDETTLPHHTLFLLSARTAKPSAPLPVARIEQELRIAQENEILRDPREQLDKAFELVGVTRGMRVAEVGAGQGYVVEKLARRVGPEGKVYAEDTLPGPLEALKLRMAQRQLTNFETIIGKDTDPLLPRASLDFVVITATMYWVDAPVELFRNIAPSLKPGGKLVVIEPEHGQLLAEGGIRASDRRFRTRAEFLDIFERSGFKVDRIDSTTPYRTIFVLSPDRDDGK